jgi:hypothetical protein
MAELDLNSLKGIAKGAGVLGDMKGDNLSFLRELTGLIKEINNVVSNPNITAMVKARQAQANQGVQSVPTQPQTMQSMPVQRDPITPALPAPKPQIQKVVVQDPSQTLPPLPEAPKPKMSQADMISFLSTPEGLKSLKTGLALLQSAVGDITLSEVDKRLDDEIKKCGA